MKDIVIRHETEYDFESSLEVKRLSWLSAYSHIFSPESINNHFNSKLNSAGYKSEYIDLAKNTKQLYVAELDGKVVATMNIAPKHEAYDFVEILWLYVHPDYQRMGIGKKLYDLAKLLILEQGVKKIHIEALTDNKIGCSFYSKNGGKIISTKIKEMLGTKAELSTFRFDIEPIVLETERLILRKYKETDLDDYFEYAGHKDVGPRIGFEPYTDKNAALERIKLEMQKPFHFAIELKETHKVVGSIELMNCKKDRYSNLEIEDDAKEIGFLLSPHFWGKGIMPEACKKIMSFAFETLHCPAIYMGHAEANTQSERVQDKMGFKKIGKLEGYRTWIDGKLTNLIERKMTIAEYKKIKDTL